MSQEARDKLYHPMYHNDDEIVISTKHDMEDTYSVEVRIEAELSAICLRRYDVNYGDLCSGADLTVIYFTLGGDWL